MEELGFTVNPYDQCMVNKIIKGKKGKRLHQWEKAATLQEQAKNCALVLGEPHQVPDGGTGIHSESI
jgi:hypothetical protein